MQRTRQGCARGVLKETSAPCAVGQKGGASLPQPGPPRGNDLWNPVLWPEHHVVREPSLVGSGATGVPLVLESGDLPARHVLSVEPVNGTRHDSGSGYSMRSLRRTPSPRSRPPSPRQLDDEDAASSRMVADVNLAAVRPDRLSSDGQAEAQPCPIASAPYAKRAPRCRHAAARASGCLGIPRRDGCRASCSPVDPLFGRACGAPLGRRRGSAAAHVRRHEPSEQRAHVLRQVLLTRSRKPSRVRPSTRRRAATSCSRHAPTMRDSLSRWKTSAAAYQTAQATRFQAREHGRADVVAELIPVLPLKLTAPCLRISCATCPSRPTSSAPVRCAVMRACSVTASAIAVSRHRSGCGIPRPQCASCSRASSVIAWQMSP
jgi:hypothetical protein